MELTAFRMIVAALPIVAVCLVGGVPASNAQRIVSFPSAAGYETISRDQAGSQFPSRRQELLQALDFLEAYERGIKQNDWDEVQDLDEDLYGDEAAEDALDLGNVNEIYPEDLDLDFRQDIEEYPESPIEDNTVDIPDWLASYLLREAQGSQEEYPVQEEEPDDLPLDLDDQELLEALLEEEEEEEKEEEEEEEVEAVVEALEEELQREEEEAIEDIMEQEMEDQAAQDILDDLWAQEVLQEDAEEKLKWLLIEEEERLQREEEETDEDEDPFEFEFSSESYSEEPDRQSYPESFDQGFTDYAADYPMVGDSEEVDDLVGEYLDEAEEEELMDEAEEILELQEMEDEEEERQEELEARDILESVIESLTKQAIQEEMEEEGLAEEDEEEDEEEEEEGEVEEEDTQTLSELRDEGTEEDVQQEVYDELAEFLENEIDQALEDIAGDILQAIDEEAEEAAEGVEMKGEEEEGEANFGESEKVTSEESEDEDECSSLQYFIDDCNIVNNYGDLGADGYKELFAGACNRHQLCYACGEYYDVGSKLCDELYKAEMLARCDQDDPGCKQRAKYFWLVARNNRIPDLESSPFCADPCILNYMVEV